jgi:hypothetical protein
VEPNLTRPGQAAPATAERGQAAHSDVDKWFLTAHERGNPHTELDSRHADGAAWSTGNLVQPLVHGAAYFSELLAAIRRMGPADQLMLTDWRGDRDELLEGPGTEVGHVLADAARRGVVVRALVWRSHLDRMRYHEGVNRRLGEEIHAAGGECLLDQRVRGGGSHHQKLVVLRHPGRPEADVAFIGGIDLCHGRKDDSTHAGDIQPCPIGAVYGDQPPWHDVQVAIYGPAVADVETAFRERWNDPAPLTRNPYRRWRDRALRPHGPPSCPPRLADPPVCGTDAVQILRTYPYRRPGYAFAPDGERSIARAYHKALGQARHLIYLEDQYIWSPHVVCVFADALAANPDLRMIAVVPQFPDRDSPAYNAPQLLPGDGRWSSSPAPAASVSLSTASRTPPGSRYTCTPRCAWWTTSGPPSVRTTSTCARGPTTASSAAPSSTSHRPATASPCGCGSRWPVSISTAPTATTRTCATRSSCSRRSRRPPRSSTPGMPPASGARARPVGCAVTRRSRCPGSPRVGPARCTG